VPNQTSEYRIMKDGVTVYNTEKHRLPCWNCLVKSVCFTEKKATKRAKYLRYTLRFEDPCVESVLAMDLIEFAASDLIIPLSQMDELDTPQLFDTAIIYFQSGVSDFINAAYVMFIFIVHRNAEYIREDYDNAYYYLGNIFHLYFKEIDFAIDLYSKGIDLTTKNSSIFENRGFCYLEKNDIVNALNDFKNAKDIDGGTHPDLEKIIDEIENR
jgi:tetratricopeptide (TPR) repeat protein